jgi:hypothetical protein
MSNTHPTAEDWMSYLYGEDAPVRHLELEAHLRACPTCRNQVEQWRHSMRSLDHWSDVRPRRKSWAVEPALRWAVAAAVMLGIGIGVGRLASAAPRSAQLRELVRMEVDARLNAAHAEFAQILERRQAEMAQKLQAAAAQAGSEEARQVLGDYAKVLDEQRTSDRQAYLAAFRQLDERQRAEVGNLREALQTVALNADDGLNRAQEQLLELASSPRSTSP